MQTQRLVSIAALVLAVAACTKTPITGRNALIMVSPEQEQGLGKEAYQQLIAEKKVASRTAPASQVVEKVGREIAAVSGYPNWDWEFKVFVDPSINAFALPGGKVGVHTGLIDAVDSEAELAAVIGHEVGHAIARHGGQRITQGMLIQSGMAVADVSLGNSKYKNEILALLGVGGTVGVMLPYGRKMELEADRIGLVLMAKAGYDPHGATIFWERAMSKKEGGAPPELLSTHPTDRRRIAGIEQHLPEALAVYGSEGQRKGMGAPIPDTVVSSTARNKP